MSSMMRLGYGSELPTALQWDTDQVGKKSWHFIMNISEDQLYEDKSENRWSAPLSTDSEDLYFT